MNEEQLKINLSSKAIELLSSSTTFKSADYKNMFESNMALDVFFKSSSNVNKDIKSNNSTSNKVDNNLEHQVIKEGNTIKSFLMNDEYIEGEISKTQLYLEGLYYKNKFLFRDSFQKAWLELYSLDENYIYTFICIASAIEYEWLDDRADMLVIAGCCHQSPLVNEAAIRAVESWENTKHLGFLESIRPFEVNWLDEYKQDVTEHLKSLL